MLSWLIAPIAVILLDRKIATWQLGIQSLAIFCIVMGVWAWFIKFLYFPEISTTWRNIAYSMVAIFLFIGSSILGAVLGIFVYGE